MQTRGRTGYEKVLKPCGRHLSMVPWWSLRRARAARCTSRRGRPPRRGGGRAACTPPWTRRSAAAAPAGAQFNYTLEIDTKTFWKLSFNVKMLNYKKSRNYKEIIVYTYNLFKFHFRGDDLCDGLAPRVVFLLFTYMQCMSSQLLDVRLSAHYGVKLINFTP